MILRIFLILALLLPWQVQQGRPRLLIIGDSFSFGLAASSEETTYRHMLTAALDADLTYIRATTVADVPGEIPDADIIVLEIGLNDVLEDSPPVAESDWPAAYGAVLERLQAAAPLVVAATPPYALYPGHVKYAQMARYAGYIREEAAARGVRIADLWALTDCIPDCLSQTDDYTPFPPLFHGDNFHYNDRGHVRIADVIMQQIRPTRTYLPIYIKPEEQH